ncbi:integrase [Methylobacterium durans]|uniref:Integrase n=1 Tax=Methylobacterium durans TaxID=2202825 RepID=A0A2U8WEU6_9HYPH|nr:integrase [Methylobacterium durans]AWN43812.1 integrase [Methylobacterium durans]
MRSRKRVGAVELPRYVWSRPNKIGRHYYSYTRHRGRDWAWPTIPIPFDPQTQEFWQRCKQCEALEAGQDGGEWRWSWRGPSGRLYPLPSPKAPEFWPAIDDAGKRDASRDGEDRKTFGALVEAYTAHKAYADLADLTKRDYDRHLREIVRIWGDEPVSALTAVDAQEAIDSFQSTPSVARYFRAVLSKLIGFGVPRGFATVNVVADTEKVEHEVEPHEPWPDWAFELFFEHARPALQLPVYSALYTGQRSVDVVPMARPAAGANAIELVARKTGRKVFVPIHSEYREILTRTHLDHPALHLREGGEPWTLAAYRTAWQRDFTSVNAKGTPTSAPAAKKAAMARLREAGLVFHGLRKNAVNMLLEAGGTEAEVSAIVEMSEQMVRHYSRDVNKRRLARNMMRKLEEGWAETRRNLFGEGASAR